MTVSGAVAIWILKLEVRLARVPPDLDEAPAQVGADVAQTAAVSEIESVPLM
nr:hypothetical protein GCM10017611_07760 [Rhodococcus wratislaviensis]